METYRFRVDNNTRSWTLVNRFVLHSLRILDMLCSTRTASMHCTTAGNGWAAAGMLRVLATIMHSQYKNDFKQEISDLASWINEIHTGIYPHLVGIRFTTTFQTTG